MTETTGAIYLCIKQFNARLGDELSLKVGDKVEVLADDSEYNDGWFMGKNLLTSQVGLYPKSFTQILNDNQDGTLLRLRSRRVNVKKDDGVSVDKITLGVEKLNVHTPETPSKLSNQYDKGVTRTMSDIDKALEELQTNSFDDVATPSKSSHQRTQLAHSITEDLNPLHASEWTPKQVLSYFAIVLGFDMDVAGKFARHKITGAILFQLDLAHLKELDIDSFGTRFEVYKQIENLRAINDRAKKPNGSANGTANGTALAKSQLTEPELEDSVLLTSSKVQSQLLPSASIEKKRHHRKRSQSVDELSNPAHTPDLAFASPRKAPEPPSLSPMNKNFKFGNGQSPNTLSMYMTKQSASSAGLGISQHSRPASLVYEASIAGKHSRNPSGVSQTHHRRHLSFFSFLSGDNRDEALSPKRDQLTSPAKMKRESKYLASPVNDAVDIDHAQFSPHKLKSNRKLSQFKDEKRLTSDLAALQAQQPPSRLKNLRTASTQNFRNLTGSKKLKTSAFQEGIREITPEEAIKTSNFSGMMAKKSGNKLVWQSRYFTLHGTRLSYFTSLRDKKEKGLIDITAHKVIPISTDGDNTSSNDKYIALYASTTGFGRYCFKLVPPAPGFKKGLTFTQPKTHYFAVETDEEMRGWIKALMTATIDIDDSVPVVSSCSTPTVSLSKAQELLAKAREETKQKDEELRAKGYIRDGLDSLDNAANSYSTFFNDGTVNESISSAEESSPLVESLDDTTVLSIQRQSTDRQPKLSIDTSKKSPTTPQTSANQAGFASPYLLASGLLSPKSGSSIHGVTSPTLGTPSLKEKRDYFDAPREDKREDDKPIFSNSAGRVVSGSKKRDKMLAYSSDGLGNHTFVITKK